MTMTKRDAAAGIAFNVFGLAGGIFLMIAFLTAIEPKASALMTWSWIIVPVGTGLGLLYIMFCSDDYI